jgi:hypothetical protein
MSSQSFKYDEMVEEALRGVMRKSLDIACAEGLPGNHHFYITFKTGVPGVAVPEYLSERYPDEMTIVLQYQFWDLLVDDEHFEVALSFNDVREKLYIPFEAVTGFADPSVKFGLQFQVSDDLITRPIAPISEAEHEVDEADDSTGDNGDNRDSGEEEATGQVVSLDQFRKKK